MVQEGLKPVGYLDQIKATGGNERLKSFFQIQVRYNVRKAISLLNDENLNFSTLFLLYPQVKKWGLSPYLNFRNQSALDMMYKIQKKNPPYTEFIDLENKEKLYPVLKWILETGFMDDGLNNQYDNLLDKTSLFLIKIYNDTSSLPRIIEMIFNRFRKGFFIYDLTFAAFESGNHQCLPLIASYLHSSETRDLELVHKLLGFIPCLQLDRSTPWQQYANFMRWYEDNHLFLYYTGETFQQSHVPHPFSISYEAKYLCSPLNEDCAQPSSTERKEALLRAENFKNQPLYIQDLLSEYSFLLYRQNLQSWNYWIQLPLAEQLHTAMAQKGGLS